MFCPFFPQDMNQRWHGLLDGLSERRTRLERALLNLGQFQSAIDELLAWIDRTGATLDEAHPVHGDPKAIEIELAKLRVSELFDSLKRQQKLLCHCVLVCCLPNGDCTEQRIKKERKKRVTNR